MADPINAAHADVTEQLAKSPNWGTGGSFVFDPATCRRVAEGDGTPAVPAAPAAPAVANSSETQAATSGTKGK